MGERSTRDAEIRSARLRLRPMSPPLLAAFLAGRRDESARLVGAGVPGDWPDEHDARFLRLRLGELGQAPELQEWIVRAVVLDHPRPRMIGHAGFHGPPGRNGPGKAGALELGYTIFEPFRGNGYATEAARALMDWARARHGVEHFIASVAPGNVPSLAVVRRLGFEQIGEQWDDEDGLELVFELGSS